MLAEMYGLYFDVNYSHSVEPLRGSQPHELKFMFDFIIKSTLMSKMEANYFQAD